MKIAIMTWLHNGNYGSMLQAYALQKYLRDQGYDVTNIDYEPGSIQKVKNLIENRNSPKLFLEKYEAWKVSHDAGFKNERAVRKEKFDQFCMQNMQLSDKFRKPKELKAISDTYDIYICGSDQIWSPYLLNPVYYLCFVGNRKKIAYAASFGVTSTTTSKRKQINDYIQRFSDVSIRESEGLSLLDNKNIFVAVDPTLLLSKEEWEGIAMHREDRQGYVLCYFLKDNQRYFQAAIRFAEQKGLKLVTIPSGTESYKLGEVAAGAGPADWAALVHSAGYVFTDSFHAVVFSLIFRREFFAFNKYADSDRNSQNCRVKNLLTIVGLEERIIEKDKTETALTDFAPVNYQKVWDKLEAVIEKSKKWLIDAIEK